MRKASHLPELQKALAAVTKHITLERCFETLEALVRRYSPSQHERVLAEYIAGRLSDLGLEVDIQEISEESCNVVGRLPAQDSSYTCLFAGHMDTVPIVGGWVRDALRLTAEGDRLNGLGTCDMKGRIAGALVALEAIVECGLRPLGTIVVAMLADEERWSLGAKRFLKDQVKADFCLLGEPCFDKMAIGWPGKIAIECTVKGVSGHAGRPWEGVNAIDEASRFLAGLAEVPVGSHPGLGAHTFVPLSIQGGNQAYSLTIPDTCSFTLSKQTVPGESQERVLEALAQHAVDCGMKARLTTRVGTPFYPPAEISPDHPMVHALKAAFAQVSGRDLEAGYGKGVCDADYLVGEAAIPTVSFGPEGGGLHAADEWVSAEKLVVASKVYALMALYGLNLVS